MKKRMFLFLVAWLALATSIVAQPPRFMSEEESPDPLVFLPAPPDVGDKLFINDWIQYQWGKSVRDSDQGRLAYSDAHHASWYNLCEVFRDQFGLDVTPDGTPAIYDVMSRSTSDAHAVNRRAKNYFQRRRPFAQFNEPSLVPENEDEERDDYSYPSGHASRGWIVALVLAEINPEATAAIFERAIVYGQGRVICGYHYQSDVDASRLVAISTFAALHGNAEYLEAMAKAKAEFQRLSKKK